MITFILTMGSSFEIGVIVFDVSNHKRFNIDLRCSKTILHQSISYLNADLPLYAMKDLISEFPHQRVPANLSVKDRLPAKKKQNHHSVHFGEKACM